MTTCGYKVSNMFGNISNTHTYIHTSVLVPILTQNKHPLKAVCVTRFHSYHYPIEWRHFSVSTSMYNMTYGNNNNMFLLCNLWQTLNGLLPLFWQSLESISCTSLWTVIIWFSVIQNNTKIQTLTVFESCFWSSGQSESDIEFWTFVNLEKWYVIVSVE